MTFGVFSIRDEAAQAFVPPFIEATSEMALRKFKLMQLNNDQEFKFMPEDFSLWKLGEYDNETGIIDGFNEPVLMERGRRYEEDQI